MQVMEVGKDVMTIEFRLPVAQIGRQWRLPQPVFHRQAEARHAAQIALVGMAIV
ncbi:hypothetical protein D3C87_2003650 [compost metagenome]